MKKVVAEAPGKVIISGEHFVVHGAVALVAAIPRHTRVEVTRSEKFTVITPFGRNTEVNSRRPLPLESVIREVYRRRDLEPGVTLKVTSNLPTGAGLGSSASTMVSSIAAVAQLEGWGFGTKELVETSMLGEKIIHGNPSGVDVAASVFGGLLQFRVSEKPRNIPLGERRRFLVVYSGRRRNTGRLVSKVSLMKGTYPALFAKLVDSATRVTELATALLSEGRIESLGEIMTYNHAVLGMVGASNEQLDYLVDLCLRSGGLGAKLTGAGGGGSVLAVAPSGGEEVVAERISKEGYDTFIAEIPTRGVRVWTID